MRALLRIARRDALRAKGRSALIVLMIALPVFAATFADVLGRTAQADPDEVVTRALGTAQYRLEVQAPVRSGFAQAPDPTEGAGSSGVAPETGEPVYADPGKVRPTGGRVLTAASGQVEVRTRRGIGRVEFNEVAAADPGFAGRFRLESGRAPRDRSEVLVTPEVLERTGGAVGAPLVMSAPAARVTVVGTARQAGVLGDEAIYALPGTLVGRPEGIRASEVARSVYVVGGRPLSWRQIVALNTQGISAYDRDVVRRPPPRAEVPYYAAGFGRSSGVDIFLLLVGAVLVGLTALEVVLLAGAAFAVGARRQARSLALLAASGATPRQVRWVVLAGGAVLGGAAGVAGLVTGVLAAAGVRPLLEAYAQAPFARFDLRPLELGAIGAVGVLTGLLAAVLPARNASRQDVVAALAGRRGALGTRRRVPVIGVAMTAIGVAAASAGSVWTAALEADGVSSGQSYILVAAIAGGAALAVLGLVICSPAVVGLVGRLGRWLPLAPRLAVRDAARHRGRSAPAVSAVLAAVSGSAALLLFVAANDDRDRRLYAPSLPAGTAGVSLVTYGPSRGSAEAEPVLRAPGPVARAVGAELPVRRNLVVTQVRDCPSTCRSSQVVVPPENECPVGPVGVGAQRAAARTDWRCPDPNAAPAYSFGGGLGSGGFVIGDGATLAELYGVEDARAARVLAAGGVVAFSRNTVLDGKVAFEVFAPGALESEVPKPERTVRVAAVHVGGVSEGVVLSLEAARRMGLQVAPSFVHFRLDRLPTRDEQDAADASVQATGANGVTVERGYESDYGLGILALVLASAVITLGAAGIATGLAQADARADHATLAAVGAAPRLRRKLAGLQALLVAGLGTGLGIAVGFVPAAALIGSDAGIRLVLPWAPLLGMLVGVPLLAAAGAWACTRSRVPLDRRIGA